MLIIQTRRRFINSVAMAGAAGLLHVPRVAAAEELLRAEGFTDIRFVDTPPPEIGAAIARGKVDFGMTYAAQFVMDIDGGAAVTVIGGVTVAASNCSPARAFAALPR